MPTIQNFALHAFDFPQEERGPKGEGFPVGTACKFPAAVAFAPGKVRPSETEIDEATLANLKAHDIGGTWFGPAGLVVKAEAETASDVQDEGSPIPGTEGGKFFTEASSPTMPWGSGPRPENFVETPVAPAAPAPAEAPVEGGVK